jgi:membrane complex biogenesis BtpA family protein
MNVPPNSSLAVNLFQTSKPIIGVIHLLPLMGSPRWRGDFRTILQRAVQDALTLIQHGIDGLIIENYGDAPFFPDQVEPHVIAAMTQIAAEVKAKSKGVPVGINVLRNDAQAAMAIATVTDAQFVRVNVHAGVMITDQGIIQGQAHKTLRYRSLLKSEVKIFADVFVKHATPLSTASIASAAQDTYYRGLADALIVTGTGTGVEANVEDIHKVKEAVPEATVFVGSGVNVDNLETMLRHADGAIIGTALKGDGIIENEVDGKRVKKIMQLKKKLFLKSNQGRTAH